MFDVVYLALVAFRLLFARDHAGLKRFVDLLHAAVYFPVGLLVCTLYWGIMGLDPASLLSMPTTIQPVWHNHALHSLPFLLAILDAFLIQHKYPSDRKGVGVVFAFAFVYLS